MKKIFLILGIFCFFKPDSWGQKRTLVSNPICGTPFDMPDPLAGYHFPESKSLSISNPVITVRIYVHIVRTNAGTRGVTTPQMNTALNILATDFNAQGICISLIGTDVINNSSFVDADCFSPTMAANALFNTIVGTNSHPNAIDIYLLPVDNSISAGKAGNIPSGSLVIAGNYINTNTGVNSFLPISHVLSHEFGHCLGLFHTFHGTCTCEAGACAELVNGTNGATCGDFIADTPADPFPLFNSYTNAGCNLANMTAVDANGQLYNPDTRNIMAYTPPDCMGYFSVLQGVRMRNTIAVSGVLQPRVVPTTVFVQNRTFSSGAILFAASENIFAGFNVTSGTTGNVTNNGTSNLEFRASNNVYLRNGFYANSSGGAVFAARITDVCNILNQFNAGRSGSLTSNNTEIKPGGIENYEMLKEAAYLAPNPANAETKIILTLTKAEQVYISITDLQGRVNTGFYKKVYLLAGRNTINIPINDLGKGLYIVKAVIGNKTKTFKLIKM